MSKQSKQTSQQSSLHQLGTMLLELDDLLVSCMRCGMCQAVCPVYGVTLREADVTRGKIALLENLAHEMIADVNSVNDKLNRCLLCSSCQANCPSGVPVMDIFLRARSIVAEYQGLNPLKKAIFRGLLSHPRFFSASMRLSSAFQGLFLRKASKSVGTRKAPLLKPLIGDRHFPPLADAVFHSESGPLDIPAGSSGLKVAFFPGCVADNMFTNLAEASLKVFRKHGVGVFMPMDLVCCGIPALASGDRVAYEGMVRQNLQVLGQGSFDYLISPCATCASTIKETWPNLSEYFSIAEQSRIAALAEKSMDITAFLVDILHIPLEYPEQKGKRVTYHDSCHLKKSLGVASQPRAILAHLPGYQLVEMPEADRCCGSGGSFTLYHYDLSKDIGKRKRDNIVAVKPDVVAAACPACMMQLMDMLSRNGDEIPVRHVVELYADTL